MPYAEGLYKAYSLLKSTLNGILRAAHILGTGSLHRAGRRGCEFHPDNLFCLGFYTNPIAVISEHQIARHSSNNSLMKMGKSC